ncbi:MAG: ABC transporter permease [Oscillospiraceae bacterium]|nr:ABC transporter permease [Candidatus Equicaccousia limihippi]
MLSKKGWWQIDLKSLWRYRDLIFLFVKRSFVAQYKQTVLGPLWAIIQPLLTTVVFTVVFGNIAGLAPSGVPKFAFYFCGYILWSYFSSCLTATSNTFITNAHIMGKAYFPRLCMPIATSLSQLISFVIQFVIFIAIWVYYFATGSGIHLTAYVFMAPLLVIQMALLSVGVGIIISSLTTRYRDLSYLVSFGVQLWMYASPVAYDTTKFTRFDWLFKANPVTPVINTFRLGFLGIGEFAPRQYAISVAVTLAVFIIGVIIFNKVEKTFADTV